MTATILDGREVARTLRNEIAVEVRRFVERHQLAPTLAVVRAGEDSASVSYARAIERASQNAGLGYALHLLPGDAEEDDIVSLVESLNADKAVHGIMIQEPLPPGVNEALVKAALSPDKDVDGVHPVNAGRLAQAAPVGRPPMVEPFFVPATPAGGLEILKRYNVLIEGARVVIIGRSNIVGKPMALLMLRENATPTICHSRTANLPTICREADILCTAIGQPRLVKGDWIKPGAVVIDFGVNFQDGEMCGDVDWEQAVQVAGMITPVPGGTGPMTNVMLMRNVVEAARRHVES